MKVMPQESRLTMKTLNKSVLEIDRRMNLSKFFFEMNLHDGFRFLNLHFIPGADKIQKAADIRKAT